MPVLRRRVEPALQHRTSGDCIGMSVLCCRQYRKSVGLIRSKSSAAVISEVRTVRPGVLAVFRLMASSNLVGCSIGRPAGFVKLSLWRSAPQFEHPNRVQVVLREAGVSSGDGWSFSVLTFQPTS